VSQQSPADGISDNVLQQIHAINDTLSELVKAVQSSQSFWNSQLFAAILGASAAISVVMIQQLWNWRKNIIERLEKTYEWIAEQNGFWNPKALYNEASRTSYVCKPDKLLGEKMVIELRRRVKYWKYPDIRLRRLFKRYEKLLLQFNSCDCSKADNVSEHLAKANVVFTEITHRAYKRTGENQWTT
jgi:hypothetical protein